MIRVKVVEFRKRMHHYLEKVAQGHRVILLHYGDPIGEVKLPTEASIIYVEKLEQLKRLKRIANK